MEPQKTDSNVECAGFTFISSFDSGNLAHVELVPKNENAAPNSAEKTVGNDSDDSPDYEFNIWTKPDCAGTEYENNNSTWFYFGIKGGTPCAQVKLNLMNLNKQCKMYSQGMAPVWRVVPGRSHWDRIRDRPTYLVDDHTFVLSFKYRTLDNPRAIAYFAFTYPFSYVDLQNMLANIDARFRRLQEGCIAPGPDDIYYHRECVCHSLEGRRVELLTVSSHHLISTEREPRLAGLFPVPEAPRPFRFLGKKVVFLSARVHPGETPSSFVLNGLLQLLLSRDDPLAAHLRKAYVFKLIPVLNPDGVSRGHYRTDTRGVNLNRVYLDPSPVLHPSVFAARALLRYHHLGHEEPDSLEEQVSTLSLSPGQEPVAPSGLHLYVDLHGHASKKGIFMYGNHFETLEDSVECMLLPRVMALNCPNFHFAACNFTERNMYLRDRRDGTSREGSGRVAVLKMTGLVRSYTLECNYNTGRIVNILPPCARDNARYSAPSFLVPPKYTPHIFEEVGRALGVSILDLSGQNPWSRLPNSEFHTLSGVRDWLRANYGGTDAGRPPLRRQVGPATPRGRLTVKSPAGRPPLRGPELKDSDRKESVTLGPRARAVPCRPPSRKPRRAAEARDQGPKRMKISCLKPENTPGPPAKSQELVVRLEEILSLPEKLGAFLGPARNTAVGKKKLVLQAIAGSSRADPAVPGQEPAKTLQKRSGDGKKRAKAVLRSLATTMGKLRAADPCQGLFVEKKRKKCKAKHAKHL
ncbi:cytosolic carboxypeptidase-like protein 5 [Bacillus rossius redtenbacheri]|uniref:cytosolic carboxypeptidase-like protein 5 n=1 Tax=Bacillus rossius redtenbacheri TaxID=93214 RepID=UPI002FDE87A0